MSGYERMQRLLGIGYPPKKQTYTPASLTATGSPGDYQELYHHALCIAIVEPREDDPDHPDYVLIQGKSTVTTNQRMSEAHQLMADKPRYHPHPAHINVADYVPYNATNGVGSNAERWSYDPSAPKWRVIVRDLGDNVLTWEQFDDDNAAHEYYAQEFSERDLDTADRVTLYRGTCKRAEKTRKSEDHDAKTQARRETRWKVQQEQYERERAERQARDDAAAALILNLAAELTPTN